MLETESEEKKSNCRKGWGNEKDDGCINYSNKDDKVTKDRQ